MFTEPAHKNIRCVIHNGMRKCARSLHSSIYRNEGGGGAPGEQGRRRGGGSRSCFCLINPFSVLVQEHVYLHTFLSLDISFHIKSHATQLITYY